MIFIFYYGNNRSYISLYFYFYSCFQFHPTTIIHKMTSFIHLAGYDSNKIYPEYTEETVFDYVKTAYNQLYNFEPVLGCIYVGFRKTRVIKYNSAIEFEKYMNEHVEINSNEIYRSFSLVTSENVAIEIFASGGYLSEDLIVNSDHNLINNDIQKHYNLIINIMIEWYNSISSINTNYIHLSFYAKDINDDISFTTNQNTPLMSIESPFSIDKESFIVKNLKLSPHIKKILIENLHKLCADYNHSHKTIDVSSKLCDYIINELN